MNPLEIKAKRNGPSGTWRPVLGALLLLDAAALGTAFFAAYWLRIASGLIDYNAEAPLASYVWLYLYAILPVWLVFHSNSLYSPRELFFGTGEYVQAVKGVSHAVLVIIVLSFFERPAASRGWLVLFWALALVTVVLGRFLFRRVVRRALKTGAMRERVLIVGANEEARVIAKKLLDTRLMDVVGFLDEFSLFGEEVAGGLTVKGSPQDYERVAREEGATRMILVPDAVSWESMRDVLAAAMRKSSPEVLVAPGFNELYSASLRIGTIAYVPILRFQPGYMSRLSRAVKAGLDLGVGALLFLLTLPVLGVLAAWLLVSEGRPIFEKQEMVGRYGTPFFMYRFRVNWARAGRRFVRLPGSKTNGSRGPGMDLLHKVLILAGIEGLPQLLNVLRGQMSLVGPRPFPSEDLSRYDEVNLTGLLAVKPGITGPWAVWKPGDLRDEISMTLAYIYAWTPWKDLQVLMSAFQTLFRRGAEEEIQNEQRCAQSLPPGSGAGNTPEAGYRRPS